MAERHRRDERAEPDARRLAAERGERHPRVGRARARVALADAHVVVGTEERVESQLLGEPGDREQLVVGRALLRLGEDAQPHGREATRSHAPRVVAAASPRGDAARPHACSAVVLNVDHWPALDRPLMIVALSGLGRRGRGGRGRGHGPARAARPTRIRSRRSTSPTSSTCSRPGRPRDFAEGGMRVIDWPEIQFVAGRAGRDIVARARSRAVAALAGASRPRSSKSRAGSASSRRVTLGGMPALVSHRQSVARARDRDQPFARAGGRSVASRLRRARPARRRSCSTRSAPPGSRASGCGCRCRSTSRDRRRRPRCGRCSRASSSCTALDLRLPSARRARRRVLATASRKGSTARPDVKEIVDRLDRDAPAPSGDELVGEIERFLRSQPEE